MKKTILLLFTLISVNISAIAQCNQRPNADHYLLQGNTYLHADEIDLEPLDSNGNIHNYDQTGYIISHTGVNEAGDFRVIDVAQLQYSNTLHTIVGVSALLLQHDYGTMNAYLCIADSNFNIYRRVKIPNDSVDCNYTELFFEQPINVNGKFSIIWDNPKPGIVPDIYNFDDTFELLGANKARLTLYNIYKDTNNCGFYTRNILGNFFTGNIPGSTSGWEYYFDDIITSLRSNRTVAALFPIFGDLDTTLSLVGQPEDTIPQTDTSSIARVNMIEKYSNIFPNPAKEELNIQCSFRIKDIEVYNSLGQKIFSTQVNKYSTILNTTNFKKGNYVVKINTVKGITHKKFIKQ